MMCLIFYVYIFRIVAAISVGALLYHIYGAQCQLPGSILTQHPVATEQILELDTSLSHCEIYLEISEYGELVPVSLFQLAVQRHMGFAFR
jgi:hypothetical protein